VLIFVVDSVISAVLWVECLTVVLFLLIFLFGCVVVLGFGLEVVFGFLTTFLIFSTSPTSFLALLHDPTVMVSAFSCIFSNPSESL